MNNQETSPARFSDLKPPHIFRPLEVTPQIMAIQELVASLQQEEIVLKTPNRYRLDTLLVRETRLISYLGQAAIHTYVDSMAKLGQIGGWYQPITAGVARFNAYHRKGGTGNRLIMELQTDDQLEKERQWALEITRRLSGQDLQHTFLRRNITLAYLDRSFDNNRLQARIDEVKPDSINLLPTQIEL